MFKRNPLDNMRITSPFGARIHPVTRQRDFHNGIDLAARVGNPVYAVADARAVVSTYHNALGNYIVLAHQNECTLYAHLDRRLAQRLAIVKAGQVIGHAGNTGQSSGPHLHFEVHKGKYNGSSFWNQRNGKYPGSVNPEPYFVKEGEEVEERELKIEVDGKIVNVRAVMHKDMNYPNLRDLAEALGKEVDYDPVRKIPVIK